MTSSLARPFRRLLHSTACTRIAPSGARLVPGPGQSSTMGGSTNPEIIGAKRKDQLANFVARVAQPHNFGEPQIPEAIVRASRINFPDGVIRPIDLNKDFIMRPSARGRANIGPGRKARYKDVFLQLGIDPRREADNEALLCGYMTRLGRIQPRSVTLLTQRSQRLVGKAIKRAKMMGVIPIFSNPKIRDQEPASRKVVDPSRQERKDRTDYSV